MNPFLLEARVLLQLMRGLPSGDSHAERLDRFYRPQAASYDGFRERLLKGRKELVELLAPPPGSSVVELGGGTGSNLEHLGPRMLSLDRVELVDLCPALLEQARRRCAKWPDVVRVVEADATTYRPDKAVDFVFMSYAMTMIPDWRAALANAMAMLRPGGHIGVADFYVSSREPRNGMVRHGALARKFWPRWFGHDGVRLDPAHLPALMAASEPVMCSERMGAVPYLPGLRAPYYLYIGRKPRS